MWNALYFVGLFFFLIPKTFCLFPITKMKKKKNKRRKKNRVEEAGTKMKSSTQWNRRVGGWRDGGVKARGRRKQRKALTKIERGLEDFTNPEGNVRDISVIIIPAFCSGYLEDLCCLGTTKKPNQCCFLGGNLLNLNKCNQSFVLCQRFTFRRKMELSRPLNSSGCAVCRAFESFCSVQSCF